MGERIPVLPYSKYGSMKVERTYRVQKRTRLTWRTEERGQQESEERERDSAGQVQSCVHGKGLRCYSNWKGISMKVLAIE